MRNDTDPCVVTPRRSRSGAGRHVLPGASRMPGGGGQRLVNNHIPLDRAGSGWRSSCARPPPKLHGEEGASWCPTRITARNTRSVAVQNVSLVDTLPPGFKYVEGSLKIQTLPSGAAQPAATAGRPPVHDPRPELRRQRDQEADDGARRGRRRGRRRVCQPGARPTGCRRAGDLERRHRGDPRRARRALRLHRRDRQGL